MCVSIVYICMYYVYTAIYTALSKSYWYPKPKTCNRYTEKKKSNLIRTLNIKTEQNKKQNITEQNRKVRDFQKEILNNF